MVASDIYALILLFAVLIYNVRYYVNCIILDKYVLIMFYSIKKYFDKIYPYICMVTL
jgi:hypothetical protein